MATHRLRAKDGAVYFGTFTCYHWLPLIRATDAYELVYQWMKIAHDQGYRFMGYVILPNHLHFIVRVPDGGAINTMLANGKRFMAYAIIDRLKKSAQLDLLAQLQQGLRATDVARRQKHRVFDPSTDLIELFSGKMIDQKLRYIHANPVSKRWRLVDDAGEYPHSSFAFYARGEARQAPLTPYQEFGYLVR